MEDATISNLKVEDCGLNSLVTAVMHLDDYWNRVSGHKVCVEPHELFIVAHQKEFAISLLCSITLAFVPIL